MKMVRFRAARTVQHSLILALSLGVFGIACGGTDPDPVKTPARIVSFEADSSHLDEPGPVTLSWSTSNAISLDLLQDGTPLDLGDAPLAAGQLVVELEESATFELIATGKTGSPATSTVSVHVEGLPPTIASFEAPEALSLGAEGGATAELRWTGVVGADELLITSTTLADIVVDPSRVPDAQIEVEIGATTTFTLIARNAAGETSLTATTRVVPYPAITAFAADRTWVGFDDPVELSWTTEGAASVELWIDGVREESAPAGEASGSFVVNPSLDFTAELRAVNELGLTNEDSLEITVAAPEIVSFEGSPDARWLGQPLVLSWTTLGGRDLRLTTGDETVVCESNEFEVIDASTCEWEITELGQHNFSLAVGNGSGVTSEIWQVNVGTGPVIDFFTISTDRLSLGETATLKWLAAADPAGEVPTLILSDDHGTEYVADELEGELVFNPSVAGTYVFTLRAETSSPFSDPVEATVQIDVFGLPAVLSFSADPLHFDDQQHEDVDFVWTAENAVSLVLYQLVPDGEPLEIHSATGAALEAGSFSLIPDNEYTYSLVATNGAGATASDEISLTLAPPAVLSFTATPQVVAVGQPILLEWTTSMANEVEIGVPGDSARRPYIREETLEPFLDVTEMGGVHLPVVEAVPPGCPFGPTTSLEFSEHSCAPFTFPGGFTFPFDGVEHTEVRVYTNGYISFDMSPAGVGNVNHGFPTTTEGFHHVHIAPFWDGLALNLNRDPTGNIHTLLREDPAGDSLVIQWKNIGVADNSVHHATTTSLNFEVILWENGDFEFRYGTMEPGTTTNARANGDSATIGFQTPSRSASDMLNLNTATTPRGLLAGRSFRYRLASTVARSGSFVWLPYATEDHNVIELRAKRAGASTAVESLDITVLQRPTIEITTRPSDPVLLGAEFRVAWKSDVADGLAILDGLGQVVCEAENQLFINEGFCDIEATEVGTNRYTIRAIGALDAVTELPFEVEVYPPSVRVDVTASSTSVRPGDSVTIDIAAIALDGGATPKVFGSLPMVEVTDPASQYSDIANTPEATSVSLGLSGSGAWHDVVLPSGFSFPYFGVPRTELRVFNDGYVSFDKYGTMTGLNRLLPDTSSASYANVHLAPFWDDLNPHVPGTVWTKLIDPDTFVIQWTAMSMHSGSSAAATHNLNFQIVLFRSGEFEYRYGTMAGLSGGATNNSCYEPRPGSCQHEANGASATIGYQNPDWGVGTTHHFGGTSNGASTTAYPGGLSNKTFRYKFWDGSGQITFTPLENKGFVFCAEAGPELDCRHIEIEAEFGIDEFSASTTTMEFNAGATLGWRTHGGRSLTIRENGDIIHTVTDLAEVDQGSFAVNPSVHSTYRLDLTGDSGSTNASLDIEVARVKLTSTQSAGSSFPGQPITISWTMTQVDPSVQPVVVAPMEEVTGSPFSELDLTIPRPDVEVTTVLSNTDSSAVTHAFAPGFEFPYFGQTYTSVRVISEGYLSFDLATSSATGNQALPPTTANFRRHHLMPFWDDLRAWTNGKVLAARFDEHRYVIQWSETSVKVGSSADDPGSLNFMVVLHSNGDFEYRYGWISPPTGSSTACFPDTCWNEFNGSAATIGYQALSTVASTLHFGGTTPAEANKPVPGGLAFRTWKYTHRTTSGSVTVAPGETASYELCVVDLATTNTFCAEPLEIDVPWGIDSFTSNGPISRGGQVTLSWDVTGLDSVSLQDADGTPLAYFEGAAVLPSDTFTLSPAETTLYTLEGRSLGRVVRKELLVEIRGGSLSVQPPTGRFFPGDMVTMNWSMITHETGYATVTKPLVEIPAGAGQEGEYKDVRDFTGAQVVGLSSGNGSVNLSPGFSFPYFGETFDEVRAYVDGYLSFDTSGTPGVGTGSNTPLPGGSAVAEARVHMAILWDDLIVRGTEGSNMAEVWTYKPDADTFIIQWTQFSRSSGSSNTNQWDMNFEIVLHKSGRFEYRYGTMAGPETSQTSCQPATCENEANGSAATIGYQTVSRIAGHTFHYGTNSDRRPIAGGLQGRSLRFDPGLTGTDTFPLDGSKDYAVCGVVDDYVECQTIHVPVVADPGDLVISELMLNPNAGASEQWFEVRNISNKLIDLDGFVISTDTSAHLITGPLLIGPGEYLVFAAATRPDLTPDHAYGSELSLNSKLDTLEILAGSMTIASVAWDYTWLIPRDMALELDPSFQRQGTVSNDAFERWCPGTQLGTPGLHGVGCYNPSFNIDTASSLPFIDISQIGKRLPAAEGSTLVARIPSAGFSIPFFGAQRENFWVSSNGWLSMSREDPGGGNLQSAPGLSASNLPRTSQPDGPMVFAFYDQLVCNRAVWECSFTYHQGNFGGEDMLIAQWTGYRFGSTMTTWEKGGLTFQVQLWKNGNVVIAFADPDLTGQPAGSNYGNRYRGSSTWIAVESPDKQSYLTGHHRTVTDLAHRTFHFIPR